MAIMDKTAARLCRLRPGRWAPIPIGVALTGRLTGCSFLPLSQRMEIFFFYLFPNSRNGIPLV